jgi:hypothetical protein
MIRFALAVPVVAFVASVAAVSRPAELPCKVAARWVEENKGSLPTTLAELSTFDLARRKAIFSALPKAARVALWREQIEYYEKALPLSEEQRQILREVDKVLNIYVDPTRVREFDSLYTPRVKRAFGQKLARKIIAELGVQTPEDLAALDPKAAAPLSTCNCSVASDWCDQITNPDMACGGPACDATESGCGTLFSYACNGLCVVF